MKKVIMTACVAVFAAVAAQAQGIGTVADINGFGKAYSDKKAREQKLSGAEQARVESFALAAAREAERAAFLEAVKRSRGEKKAQSAEGKEKEQAAVASCPSCYTGSTGAKMMMFADSQKGRKEKQNSAKETDSAKVAEEGEEEPSWWRAIFFLGRFPGESKEDYRARLAVQGYPANQPFK